MDVRTPPEHSGKITLAVLVASWLAAGAVSLFDPVCSPRISADATTRDDVSSKARIPAPPKAEPDCEAIRACFKRDLPGFAPKDQERLIERATRCGGGTAAAAWEARTCFGVEFGRDPTTGLGVAIDVACDDVCPDQAEVFVRLASDLTAEQCGRLDGRPRFNAGGGGYTGCVPPPASGTRLSVGKDFTVRRFPGLNPEFRVSGGYGGTRTNRLGFHQGIGVSAIDGKPVSRQDEVEELLRGMPFRLPAVVAVTDWLPSSPSPEVDVELHYPSCGAVQELGRLFLVTNLLGLTGGPSRCAKRTSSIRVGRSSVQYDPHCPSNELARLERVADAIRRVARTTKARSVTPNASPECKDLDALPTDVEWSDGKRGVRLLYVDWMAH